MRNKRVFNFMAMSHVYAIALDKATTQLNEFLQEYCWVLGDGRTAYTIQLNINYRENMDQWIATYTAIGPANPPVLEERAYTGATERLDRGE